MSATIRNLLAEKSTFKRPKQKHWWFFVSGLVLLTIVTQIVWQLLYPNDLALPAATLGTKNVGGMSRVALAGEVQSLFQDKSVRLVVADKKLDVRLGVLGASINADDVASDLVEYPLWQRILPLSIMWVRPAVDSYKVSFAKSQLAPITKDLAAKLSDGPKDASLALRKGKLVVTAAKYGQVVSPAVIQQTLEATKFTMGDTTVTIASTKQAPGVLDSAVEPIKHKAEAIIGRQYRLLIPNGKAVVPDRTVIASWLVVKRSNAAYELSISQDALKKYAASLSAQVGSKAGTTQVNLVDGIEKSRKNGVPGKMVNTVDLAGKLTNAIESGEPSVALDVVLVPVAPQVAYTRSYTSSQAGLSAYVNYTASTQNIRIAVKQLGGKGWSTSARGYESTVSASTYKLYVALWLFDQMDKGKIKWSDPWLDTTVSGCFDRMTIASTNPCAEAWLSKAGRTNVNKFIWGKGFSDGTTLTHPEAAHTTPVDLLNYMVRLENGSLIKGAQRDRLLHSLSVHPYREGVPAGAGGKTYNKVGFLWDYVNDAAIVRHPKGTYVIVVMTKGYSYAKIAEITREVERIMYS